MKSWQDCLNLKHLLSNCQKQQLDLNYIRSLLPEYGQDIKQVRFEEKLQRLVVCVEPWVWTQRVQEDLDSHRESIESNLGVIIRYIKVRFLFS